MTAMQVMPGTVEHLMRRVRFPSPLQLLDDSAAVWLLRGTGGNQRRRTATVSQAAQGSPPPAYGGARELLSA
jgi:hypothetical protein